MKTVLVLGESGHIGSVIATCLAKEGQYRVVGTYNAHPKTEPHIERVEVSVSNSKQAKTLIKTYRPDYVVSCLRGDYQEQIEFHKILLDEMTEIGAKLIYLSTANVFDGDRSKAHVESDALKSKSEYGLFKIECEKLITQYGGEHVIIRLPMVLGKGCRRTSQIRDSIKSGQEITVFSELYLNITSDEMVAQKIEYIISNALTGVFHFGSFDEMLHKEIYERMISKVTKDAYKLNENHDAKGYFTLNTTRADEFPKEFQESIEAVIDSVLESF